MSTNDILIYSSVENDTWERLREALECIGVYRDAAICQSVFCLSEHLKQRNSVQPVIILFSIDSQAELDEIVAIHTPALFREVKAILILPDHHRKMTLSGLRIQPRFMTYVDSDFSEITKVLAKMMGLTDPLPGGLDHHEEMLG